MLPPRDPRSVPQTPAHPGWGPAALPMWDPGVPAFRKLLGVCRIPLETHTPSLEFFG